MNGPRAALVHALTRILPAPLRQALRRVAGDKLVRWLRGGHGGVFQHIYASNAWGCAESRSGAGSTMEYTANLRAELPGLCRELGVERFLDVPCGDAHWITQVNLRGVSYVGCDIVPELIYENQRRYGAAGREFCVLDLSKDTLPRADVLLSRDCWQHLSYDLIEKVIANVLRSHCRYLLTSSHAAGTNADVATGSYFSIDLLEPPFNFPPPLKQIADWVEPFPERYVMLWRIEDLRSHFRNKPVALA